MIKASVNFGVYMSTITTCFVHSKSDNIDVSLATICRRDGERERGLGRGLGRGLERGLAQGYKEWVGEWVEETYRGV